MFQAEGRPVKGPGVERKRERDGWKEIQSDQGRWGGSAEGTSSEADLSCSSFMSSSSLPFFPET